MKDKRIDAYIEKSADFAKPILDHVRALVHKACPQVEETIKWGFPHFDYKGEMMCSMVSFKQHCAVGFWKASLMKDKSLMENAKSESAMGHLGKISNLKDLPTDAAMLCFVIEDMKLNDNGIKVVKGKPTVKKQLVVPAYFLDVLKSNKAAQKTFDDFSYPNKKEFVEWIVGAKATRHKRIETALEWLADGKVRNWKYVISRQ